ncbi:FAD:protein FMN transferase [Asanoa sp. WMMD1127]|uniref:FAD:protein FMN transferase n=1 Tax=Asanoa sp. WMMD1127 TaxID=3016107 RepID=UPI00241607E3|nr:FAD:protein FMN transferase [Asanoa sp. WMMD1127]MDG4827277.1 FAD:protein FMN transferase [Asanoa sp. WMMD1127]
MGTMISVELATGGSAALLDEVFAWFDEVDARFSTFKAGSEVCRFDRGELALADASADFRSVLSRCADLWGETDGYFDGYATGRLDPSGFVKGWSVQVASDRLLAAGATDHCVNAGGDVRVRGHAPSGRPWRIGIRHPWNARAACHVVSGTDLAVATSGVYERGHHVVDPRRGRPSTGLRSVTLIGPDLGTADAYATAALAMGPAGVRWLGDLVGYDCVVVTDEGRKLTSPALSVAA